MAAAMTPFSRADCEPERSYDIVVVGSGVVGATLAKVLAELSLKSRKAISILVLEAGRGTGLTEAGHQAYLDTFYKASIKTPNSPYPHSPNAPAQADLAFLTPPAELYYRQGGNLPFSSNNTRALGGTTLHWMGIALRMMPFDFRTKEKYGQGEDWPIGYEDLRPYYEKAEWELGVAASREDQLRVPGSRPEDYGDYDYPMSRVPTSYLDEQLQQAIGEDFRYELGGEAHPVRLVPLPQARNTTPNAGAHEPRDYLDESRRRKPYQPYGAPEDPATGPGQRCEGNASCIPICPARAKYTALKTVQQLSDLGRLPGISVTIVTRAVATEVHVGDDDRITHISYLEYEHDSLPYAQTRRALGRRFVLAASAIENAKLLLASRCERHPAGVANRSGAVGRHLMDHPFVLAWGQMPLDRPLGPFRGPGATCDLPMRDGAFRSRHAAFRTDISNWGWSLPDDAPTRDVERLINPTGPWMAPPFSYDAKPQRDLLPDRPLFGAELRAALREQTRRQLSIGFLMEQLPDPNNRIEIDDNWRDQLGVHKPVLNYDISEYTLEGIAAAYRFAEAFFRKIGARDFTDHEGGIGQKVAHRGRAYKYIGAGHIMGTHRMGFDARSSVVDSYQQSWDHPNLYIVGCGSMPTAGTSNPTLTATALSIRTAEKMFAELELPGR